MEVEVPVMIYEDFSPLCHGNEVRAYNCLSCVYLVVFTCIFDCVWMLLCSNHMLICSITICHVL